MNPRRTFLCQLASFPLVGGAVTPIGQATAVAEPVTEDLLEAYKTWLHMEQRFLTWAMAHDPRFEHYGSTPYDRREKLQKTVWYVGDTGGYHSNPGAPSPYSRAALVMSTVGCDWREVQ